MILRQEMFIQLLLFLTQRTEKNHLFDLFDLLDLPDILISVKVFPLFVSEAPHPH